MIYFHRNISATISPRFHTTEITAHITAYGKHQLPKAAKERQGSAPSKADSRQRVARTLDAARRKGLPQSLCNKKHLNTLTGPTTYAYKKQNKTKQKTCRESPTCLALRAVLCFVCMFASLPGTSILTDDTNPHTNTRDTPIASPKQNANHKIRPNGTGNRERNGCGDQDLEPELKHGQNDRRKENMPLDTNADPKDGRTPS